MNGLEKECCPKNIILTKQEESSEHIDSCCVPDDADTTDNVFAFFGQLFQANLAKWTAGISPAALGSSYSTWLWQLAQSPEVLWELAFYPVFHANDCINNIICVERAAGGKDVRFKKDSWQPMPWRLYAEGFLQVEDWWRHATTRVPGLPDQVERTVSFWARQYLDALSPSNCVWSNPDLFHEAIRTGGFNLIQGSQIAMEDSLEKLTGAPPTGSEHFIPGKDVAITPGRVVFQNHLIELIQYEAQTKTVYKEPILVLPAWIMKYYILDLSPHNSLVKWLVRQGHTVFIISWRNPDKEDRDLGMDDYYRQGAMAAIDAVSAILPQTKINLMGYCLGGTLAMITAAAMSRDRDERLNSLTLLAAQGDFTEAGELMLFVTKSQVAFLKNMMGEQGYLDTKQMAGSFQMLRAYDLIWSKMVQDYMHGMRRGMIDLTAWNADATRMPYKMHSEYLEQLFLNNDFAEGRYTVEGKPVAAENIQLPLFAVSTEKDHVAPWQSVYKIHLMTEGDITFVLTGGGHNAGIVSEPGHPGRSYRVHESKKGDAYLNPASWLAIAKQQEGSWWQEWHDWLVQLSAKKRVPPLVMNTSLPAAPGTYVLQK
ncbi:TPA: alpha/beta fold hydrolase [Legionella pneumophila]|uniref:Polyhydroxyalkanoic synthase n=1 Tax=Legionella santicrucis TaxID=45074 RepID=A0A0W0Z1E7_9GAMM|nr:MULTISPECIES: alpha/beta fold hydrolase [Legionellaceae]HAU0263719.1 alpha/beta fold hydrolase [Legionella pneumophila]KTD62919.1 polyhydroxyalkanoic synthase [Legionella santicrucis]HAU0295850.1 alpha/beta fold hydrolase [Legionella pneumophila]HAU0946864.1 alpha/beta fold hydrolase [Legionella pneumophila]HAU0966437.1 alpha/beta fold hydrolase [Legionella pneumophila]